MSIMEGGSWIGGRKDVLSLKTLFLNHGPGRIEWVGVEREEGEKLREVVKELGLDVIKEEGKWLGNEDYLRGKGIKV